MDTISAAEFKSKMSEFLARVVLKNERFIITRHGRPVAQLSPLGQNPQHLGELKGWVEDSDSFFQIMDSIVADRAKHLPRITEL